MTPLLQTCIEKGIKITEQRKVIAEVLSRANDHPSVEQVYKRTAEIDNRISLATVYRTMKVFEENEIIERLDFRDGKSRYEKKASDKEHHHHLIDIQNNKIIEFSDDMLEEIKHEIARKLGYELVDHKLELYGIPLCDKKVTMDNPQ